MANQMLQFMKALQKTIASMENPVQTKAHFVHSGKFILICDSENASSSSSELVDHNGN